MIQNEDSFKIRTCKQCLYFLIYKASRYIKKILLDLSITLENLINRGCWYTALISFGITLLLGICLMLHLKCIRRDTRANSVQTNPFLKSNPAAAALEKACTNTTLQAPRSAVLWQLRRAVHVSCSDSPVPWILHPTLRNALQLLIAFWKKLPRQSYTQAFC